MSLDTADDPDARTYEYKDRTLLWRMVKYLLTYRKLFSFVVILTAIGIALTVWTPFILRQAIDVDFPEAIISGSLQNITFTALLYVGVQFFAWLTAYSTEYMMALMGQQAVYDIRQDLYEHVQEMSEEFHDHSSSGRVISRLTNDVDRMSELLEGGLISTFAQIFVVFAIGIVIFTVDTRLAIASLSIVPVLLITTLVFRKKLREAYRMTRKTISSVTANFAESISGARVTKSFARERISAEIFAELNEADYNSNIAAGKAQASFFPSIRFISGLGLAVVLLVGGWFYLDPVSGMTLGTIVLFLQFNDRFFRPILIIANFYTSVQSAFAGGERVFSVIDSEPAVVDRIDATPMPEVEGHVQFNNVTFRYGEGPVVLHNFTLDIQPGETIALVGDTGAGKTTVVSLLNRFYDVDENSIVTYQGKTYSVVDGSVRIDEKEYYVEDECIEIEGKRYNVQDSGSVCIDGIDIRSVTQKSLHSRIGLVLQDPFLFMGTIRENIRYGKSDATDEEIIAATKAIGAYRIFEGLENGFDTEVGERGNRLSEGERQLVSFARALLANPKILVLDEATSSVDIYTEFAIQKGMKALVAGRTSIIIAHRLSTIVNADRIIVIENGRIVETGTHAALMQSKGKYYSLYELQIRPRAMQRTK